MYPTLGDLLGLQLPVGTHGFFVRLGVLAAVVVFVVEARRRGHTDDRLLIVVTGALVGGALFMRLGTWLQHVDLRENATLAEQWAYGNRSILGGLVGAWLGVHVAKRLSGYRCAPGTCSPPPSPSAWPSGASAACSPSSRHADRRTVGDHPRPRPQPRTGSPAGVPLHPSFAYEIAFHLAAFAVIWFWLRHRSLPPGRSSSGTSRRTASSASWSSSCAATRSSGTA